MRGVSSSSFLIFDEDDTSNDKQGDNMILQDDLPDQTDGGAAHSNLLIRRVLATPLRIPHDHLIVWRGSSLSTSIVSFGSHLSMTISG
jgi:hypothetical protein